jgi:hypothetical protein
MSMELALNLIWLAVVATGFALVPKRRSRLVWFALIAAAALLFPIISVSDDFNADRTFNDAAAALVAIVTLAVAFVAIGRVRAQATQLRALIVVTPSDPRSPPVR